VLVGFAGYLNEACNIMSATYNGQIGGMGGEDEGSGWVC